MKQCFSTAVYLNPGRKGCYKTFELIANAMAADCALGLVEGHCA